jgi:hypothetical protein
MIFFGISELMLSEEWIYLHMQMRLPVLPRILDPLLQDILRLLDKLSMQVNRVSRHAAFGIVFTKDKLGCLSVVLVHLPAMRLAFLGEFFGQCTIAVLVGLSRLFPPRVRSNQIQIERSVPETTDVPCQGRNCASRPPGARDPVDDHILLPRRETARD